MVSVGLLAKAAASINSIILDRVCSRLEPLEPSERERERERESAEGAVRVIHHNFAIADICTSFSKRSPRQVHAKSTPFPPVRKSVWSSVDLIVSDFDRCRTCSVTFA